VERMDHTRAVLKVHDTSRAVRQVGQRPVPHPILKRHNRSGFRAVHEMVLTVLARVGPLVSLRAGKVIRVEGDWPVLLNANRLGVLRFEAVAAANALERTRLAGVRGVGQHVSEAQRVERHPPIDLWKAVRPVAVPVDARGRLSVTEDVRIVRCEFACPLILAEMEHGPKAVVAQLQRWAERQHLPEHRVQFDEVGLGEGAVD